MSNYNMFYEYNICTFYFNFTLFLIISVHCGTLKIKAMKNQNLKLDSAIRTVMKTDRKLEWACC